MDRRLNIAITKSRLTSFSVSIKKDGSVEFSCNLELLTEQGAAVTTVCHSTESWQGKELVVPTTAYNLAGQLSGMLHEATEGHVVNLQNLLEAPDLS